MAFFGFSHFAFVTENGTKKMLNEKKTALHITIYKINGNHVSRMKEHPI